MSGYLLPAPATRIACPRDRVGFGKHGDSAATRTNTRSPWDTLHPGRPWATSKNNVPNPKGIANIKAEVRAHLQSVIDASKK